MNTGLRTCLLACYAIALPALGSEWTECLRTPQFDRFSYATANDTWRKPIGSYRIEHEGSSADGYFKVLFKAADFNALKKQAATKCGMELCSSRVVLKIDTPEAAESLRANLVKDRGPDASVEVFKAALSEVPGVGWGMTLIDLTLKLSPSVQQSERTLSQLDALIAVGGQVVYEEHLTPQTVGGCFRLTRSVYYQIMLGSESRRILLWAARYPAETL